MGRSVDEMQAVSYRARSPRWLALLIISFAMFIFVMWPSMGRSNRLRSEHQAEFAIRDGRIILADESTGFAADSQEVPIGIVNIGHWKRRCGFLNLLEADDYCLNAVEYGPQAVSSFSYTWFQRIADTWSLRFGPCIY